MGTPVCRLPVQLRFLSGFPYIEYGSVIIAHGQPAGLGKPALPSTATVTVKVKNSATLKKLQHSREPLGSLKQSRLLEVRGGLMGDAAERDLALTSNDTHAQPCCACA